MYVSRLTAKSGTLGCCQALKYNYCYICLLASAQHGYNQLSAITTYRQFNHFPFYIFAFFFFSFFLSVA